MKYLGQRQSNLVILFSKEISKKCVVPQSYACHFAIRMKSYWILTQFHFSIFCCGVNCTNVKQVAFLRAVPKSTKKHLWLDSLFALWGSLQVKAGSKHVGDIDPCFCLSRSKIYFHDLFLLEIRFAFCFSSSPPRASFANFRHLLSFSWG